MPWSCWLVGLFIFLSLFHLLAHVHTWPWVDPMDWHWEVDCQMPGQEGQRWSCTVRLGSQDGLPLGSDPHGLRASSTAPPSHWAREASWGGWSRKGVQPRDRSLTQRILSELLAGRAPLRLFFLRACALNTNQAASLGYHTNWPQTPRQWYRMGALLAGWSASRHHGRRRPDPRLVVPQKRGFSTSYQRQSHFSLVSFRKIVSSRPTRQVPKSMLLSILGW